ncbi:MAG: glycosyltransferase N-terminal domain-containing protein [Candidatus Neomarinimicrobiota bacterium]
MKVIWKILYNLAFLPLLMVAGFIVSIFNEKVREGFRGRRNSLRKLTAQFSRRNPDQLVLWFHAASHGEYEQVRPVLAGLKEVEPDSIVVVSFFSPSGYKNVFDPNIDCKIYLPLDFYWTCRRSLKLVRPHKLIFAEYDLWPNLIWAARRLGIKTTLFSARINRGSSRLWPVISNLYRHIYNNLDSVYTVSERDHIAIKRLLAKRSRSIVRVLGNPRYDQVKEMADRPSVERTKSVLERQLRVIAGSVWPDDENVVLPPILDLLNEHPELLLYWVPHEPDSKFLERTMRSFDSSDIEPKLFSECKNGEFRKARAVIVDEVGMLAELYWQGRIAYVGGGFSTGIHNVMEPAIARLPTVFGPRFHNSHAAEELLNSGGGFTISSQEEFRSTMDKLIDNHDFFVESSLAATGVIHRNIGSATRVVRGILRD